MIKKILKLLKNEYLWLALIVALGFGVRLYKIGNPVADWHSWRQADTASVTRIFIDHGIDPLKPRYYDVSYLQTGYENPLGYRFVEFPIFNLFHAGLYNLYPNLGLDKSGRLLSIFASTVSIVFVFLLGRRFLGKLGGVLAAFFFAFLPFNIFFSRVILPEPLAVTFTVSSLYFFVRWFDKDSFPGLLISGALFSLAILAKPFAGFWGLVMLYLAVRKYGFNKTLLTSRKLWIFAAVSLLPFFLWRAWIWLYPEGIAFWEWAFNGDRIRFRPAFWRWIFGERLGDLILGGWLIPLFGLGLIARQRKTENYFPLAMFFSAVFYMTVIATANVRHDYYQTLIIPSVSLVLAKGAVAVLSIKELRRPLALMFWTGAALFGLALSFLDVREFYKINHPEIIQAGQAVQRLTEKDAKVIAPYNGDTAFLYQTHRFGWPHIVYPMDQMIDLGATHYVSVNFDKQTQEIIERYKVLDRTDRYVVVELTPKE